MTSLSGFYTTLFFVLTVGRAQTIQQFDNSLQNNPENLWDTGFPEGGIVKWGKVSELTDESKSTAEAKKMFKTKLLSLLDLIVEPKSNVHVRIPPHMFDLYWEMADTNRRRKAGNQSEADGGQELRKRRARPEFVKYAVFSKTMRNYFGQLQGSYIVNLNNYIK